MPAKCVGLLDGVSKRKESKNRSNWRNKDHSREGGVEGKGASLEVGSRVQFWTYD